MNKLKVTKGEWKLKGNEEGYHTSVFTDASQNKNPFRTICTSKVNDQLQSNANLELIADAGTTYNKCGLTPSELMEQRNELLRLLCLNKHHIPNPDQINTLVNEIIKNL